MIFWAWVLGPTGAILAVPLTVLLRDMAFGPVNPPDVGTPQPVTSSTVPMPQSAAAHPQDPEPPSRPDPDPPAPADETALRDDDTVIDPPPARAPDDTRPPGDGPRG